MSGKTYTIIALMLSVFLLMLNMKLAPRDHDETKEISGYQYAQLETAIHLYPEVAEAVSRNSKHEIVTIADLKKIMQHARKIQSRRTVKVSALQPSSKKN